IDHCVRVVFDVCSTLAHMLCKVHRLKTVPLKRRRSGTIYVQVEVAGFQEHKAAVEFRGIWRPFFSKDRFIDMFPDNGKYIGSRVPQNCPEIHEYIFFLEQGIPPQGRALDQIAQGSHWLSLKISVISPPGILEILKLTVEHIRWRHLGIRTAYIAILRIKRKPNLAPRRIDPPERF